MTPPNVLYYGDNLDVLRRYVPDASVDLVYLDPPFNSNATYNVLFAEQDGSRSAAQIQAFGDTWRWDQGAARAYEETVEAGDGVARALQAFRTLLGDSNMLAYLAMMAPRLMELRRVLKPTGSLYLHCDPTASHYLKLILDAIFGPEQFRNEITWKRTNVHSDSKRWSDVSDRLLYYVRSAAGSPTWNTPWTELTAEHVASKYTNVDSDGRRYTLSDMTSPSPRPNMMYEWHGFSSPPMGWRYSRETMATLDAEGRIWYPNSRENRPRLKRYLDAARGNLLTDVWTDIDPINSQAKERLGYPTQKPSGLLERIVTASSNPGDVVLDPFCGCGTAIAAAQKLGRRWIGVDVTHLAIGLIKHRLLNTFGPDIIGSYTVIGEPTTVQDAAKLAQDDPFQFQAWALGLVGARTAESNKKGADKGIDGRLYFHDDPGGRTKQIIFSVKAGKLHAPYVRDLRGVVDREKADIGILVSFDAPTKLMRTEAASAGFYESPWGKHPKLQILTIADLLDGKTVDYPRGAANRTLRQAPRAKAPGANLALDFGISD